MGECEADDKSWKKFVKNHWNMLAFWIIAAVVAVVGAVLVYLWFVGEAQASEMVTWFWESGRCRMWSLLF